MEGAGCHDLVRRLLHVIGILGCPCWRLLGLSSVGCAEYASTNPLFYIQLWNDLCFLLRRPVANKLQICKKGEKGLMICPQIAICLQGTSAKYYFIQCTHSTLFFNHCVYLVSPSTVQFGTCFLFSFAKQSNVYFHS